MNVLSPRAARIHGVATVLAPVLLLASSLVHVLSEGGINNGMWGGIIGVWSALAFVVAFVGLCRVLEPAAPGAAPVVLVFGLLGWAAGSAFAVNAIHAAVHGQDLLFEATEGLADPAVLLAFLPWGWFAPLSFVLLGWLLWRTGTGPRWAAALLAVGGLLFVIGRPAEIDAIAVAADVALLLALVPLGVRMITGSLVAPERSPGRTAPVAG
ncbi:MAG: DUF4386 family protein [Pseudonocardia sp.]